MNSKPRRPLDIVKRNACLKAAKAWIPALCGVLVLAMTVGASAEDMASEGERYTGKEFANAFANPKDEPTLPNVLLIGDSISIGYTVDVRKRLLGKADVFRIPSNGKYASHGSKNLDKWLGQRKWDVIHFNWGLWDICYRNPKSKTQGHRDKANGTLTASPDQYRESMEKIVARLKKTDATLIWCATTPVPDHEAGRKLGDEIKYNAIAKSIMLENDILIDDLHAHALKGLPEIQKQKGDVHFNSDGYAFLAKHVAQTVSAALVGDDTAPNQKPNIVFIMADDLGPGWVDFDGSSDKINTPNLQRIAEGGMVFTRAYAAASVCSPTRAACITGMSPAQIGLTTHIPGAAGRRHPPAKGGPVDAPSINALPLDLPSYARELKKQGYATGFLGKWHLACEGSLKTKDGIVDSQYHPEHFGFDSNIGGCAYGQPKSWFDPFKNGTVTNQTKGEYLTDRLGDEAAAFIKANKDQPFHLSLWFYSVHTPIKAPKKLVQENGGNAYLAMLECMDNAVGKVLDSLSDAGVRDNTLVVFYSDNGGHKPTDWLAEKKGSLLEGGLRVPMAVSWPGVITAGSQTAEPVTSMDFFPTFVHAAGGSTKEISQLEGEDLLPLFKGANQLDRDFLYWHYPHNRRGVKYNMGSVVLSRDWKFYQGLGVVPDALFNLEDDSMEQYNALSKNPDIAERLRGQLNQWLIKVKAKMP